MSLFVMDLLPKFNVTVIPTPRKATARASHCGSELLNVEPMLPREKVGRNPTSQIPLKR
jgi:hypothetical protein